jgi:hypothetical protein
LCVALAQQTNAHQTENWDKYLHDAATRNIPVYLTTGPRSGIHHALFLTCLCPVSETCGPNLPIDVTLVASSLPTPPISDDYIDQSNPEMFLPPISDTPSSWRPVFMRSVGQDRVCSCSSLCHQRTPMCCNTCNVSSPSVSCMHIPHVHV